MDVSIIIVSYKTPELLASCVHSIIENKSKLTYEIIIVDNANGDGSEDYILSRFKDVRWIKTGYNSGFSRANNIGFKEANGNFILALNPDATLPISFLDDFLNFYKLKKTEFKSQLGLLTCRIVSSEDNSLQIGSGKRFVNFNKEINKNPFLIYFKRTFSLKPSSYDPNVSHYKNHEIDFVSGCCFIIEKLKIEQHNLYFDEDFFLYFEDLELSFRTKKIGLRNYFCGDLEIYHVNSASTSMSVNKESQIIVSEYLYYFKRFNLIQYFLLGYLINFNFWLNSNLLKRKKEIEMLVKLNFEKKLFKKYFFQIPKKYGNPKQKKSDYLKYD
ncbi:MAG: glycosyltransferase family 2 protein [Crocinitomicaceae bacterium]